MNENEKLYIAAQESVLLCYSSKEKNQNLEDNKSNNNNNNNNTLDDVDDDSAIISQTEHHEKSKQQLFDAMNPSEFSRESIMFVRYVVDVCGIQIFDLPQNEVQKLWLEFCILYNTGKELPKDWYRTTSIREESHHQQQYNQQQQSSPTTATRSVRLDATTFPTIDKTSSYSWNMKLDEQQKEEMRKAQEFSIKTSQTPFTHFFQFQQSWRAAQRNYS